MLDKKFARKYNTNHHMPFVTALNPQNVAQILNLVQVMDFMDKAHLERAEIFTVIIFIIYFIQFLWVGFQVIIRL